MSALHKIGPFSRRTALGWMAALTFLSLTVTACKQKQQTDGADQETYFSITQFLDDQWKNREGVPYTLLKVVDFNGNKDTSYVGLDSSVWKTIRSYFDAADIGKPDLYGQYHFSAYEEEVLNMTVLHYEAIKEKAFTQLLDVGIDPFTNRIKSVYAETKKKNMVYVKNQKLLYVPDRQIQIQEYEKSIVSAPKNVVVTYYFEY